MGKRVYKRRHRRLKPWAVVVLVGIMLVAVMLLVNSCSGEKEPDGSQDQASQGNDHQLDTQVPGDGQNNDVSAPQTPDIQEPAVPKDPVIGYTVLTMAEEDIGVGEQILVSNEHKYTFQDVVESQLVSVMNNKTLSYRSKDYETSMLPVAVEHLNDMMDDFVAQGGDDSVMVVSGHRTYDFQQGLFDRSAARNGLEHAKRFVAQAGGSEHHTGYAVDLWSTTTSDYLECTGKYTWIGENCHRYGYILRYDPVKEPYTKIGPESWHFRYVGVPHSYIVVENDFCYEEYIDYLRQFPFDGEHLMYAVDDTEYEIYFVEGLEVPVPENGEYTISGNNVDGFIVTIAH